MRPARKSLWKRFIQSWWGRSLAGAFIGAFLVAFSGVQEPAVFVIAMLAGALIMFFLGRLE